MFAPERNQNTHINYSFTHSWTRVFQPSVKMCTTQKDGLWKISAVFAFLLFLLRIFRKPSSGVLSRIATKTAKQCLVSNRKKCEQRPTCRKYRTAKVDVPLYSLHHYSYPKLTPYPALHYGQPTVHAQSPCFHPCSLIIYNNTGKSVSLRELFLSIFERFWYSLVYRSVRHSCGWR